MRLRHGLQFECDLDTVCSLMADSIAVIPVGRDSLYGTKISHSRTRILLWDQYLIVGPESHTMGPESQCGTRISHSGLSISAFSTVSMSHPRTVSRSHHKTVSRSQIMSKPCRCSQIQPMSQYVENVCAEEALPPPEAMHKAYPNGRCPKEISRVPMIPLILSIVQMYARMCRKWRAVRSRLR